MTLDNLRYRFGTGAGGPTLEDGLTWLAEHDFHQTDFNADHGANALSEWSDDRVRTVRELCERSDIHLGIHTLSAVNVSDFSPYMTQAVDDYLRANIDLGKRLGVERVIVHAGLHQQRLELRVAPAATEGAGMDLHQRDAIVNVRDAAGDGGAAPDLHESARALSACGLASAPRR